MNIIAAMGSTGHVSFTINRGRTNSATLCLFLSKLTKHLDSKDPWWRASTYIMLDNAPFHRSGKTREFIERLRLPVMFLGPYQFSMAPVEKLFAFIKARDLNPLLTKAFSK